MRRQWTAAEIESLFRYPEEGTSLASLLGRSEDAVTSLARRLGLRARNRVARLVAARRKNRVPSKTPDSSSEPRGPQGAEKKTP